MSRITVVLLICFASFTAGCGSNLPELATVTGVVTQDGKPVVGGGIEFVPEGGGRVSVALTDDEGRYEAYYTQGNPGVLPGKHTIRFQMGDLAPMSEGGGDELMMPSSKPGGAGAKGGSITPNTVDVAPGSNEINFELRS